jgi:hypothetical protein
MTFDPFLDIPNFILGKNEMCWARAGEWKENIQNN